MSDFSAYKLDSNFYREQLSERLRQFIARDVKELSQIQSYKTYFAILVDWLLIFAAAYVSIQSSSIFVYGLAAVIIAARQHSLLVIMHEAAHRRISTNKFINDFVGDIFAALPIFMDVDGYRNHHLQHHLYLNTDKDPDWVRKKDLPDWQFPMSRFQFVKMLGKYLFLGGSIKEWTMLITLFSGIASFKKEKTLASLKPLVIRLFYYGAVVSAFVYWGKTNYLLLYWIAPYLFVMLLFQRIRSISEHFGAPHEVELNDSRNVLTSGIEAFFLGPHNVNYHLDHHMFPSVPFYNLPALHNALMKNEDYQRWAHNNKTYLLPSEHSVLKDILKGS